MNTNTETKGTGDDAGVVSSPLFADWPKTKGGRLICSPERPMPIGCGEAHELRWAHTNLREVGEQEDGWPAGDKVTMECRDCGIVVESELPQ